ncbi:Rhomboid family protein [Novipirellula aureliae]|uniref:Rhomboid family protein n=1 Tax=Novipirellula aureliae TaxID=2527966 RepID=A0A5C6DZZ4_9BACT|nr:rhomboid family intramembrane serine protease [Novipirellula aureliae]TWU41347.1 Rhomboid family protein [Novipirellula aureliae]
MLFLPYGTDAPLYHWPIATGTIIFANVAIFFATTAQVLFGNMEIESVEFLILQFNQINPFQWISNAFMHGGFMHLLGNMFFLWAFGIVVEGKIGTAMFTGLYFLIAAMDGAAVQVPMFLLSGEGAALGASGVIFGLMVIAMLWAPENEVDCFYMIFFTFGTAEIRIIALGATFVFMQVAFLFLGGFSMSSEMLHMIGAAIGLPIGVLMLRQGLVDCEGWDVISRNPFLQEYELLCSEKQRRRILRQTESTDDPMSAALRTSSTAAVQTPTVVASKTAAAIPVVPAVKAKTQSRMPNLFSRKRAGVAAQQPAPNVSAHPDFNRLAFTLRQSIQTETMATAEQAFARIEQLKLSSAISDRTLFAYASLLGKRKRWLEAIHPLTIIANHNRELADPSRIRISQIQLTVMKKPELAIQTLLQIKDSENQTAALIKKRDQLLASARK